MSKVINDYEVIRAIAQGGMGSLFEARRLSDGRKVALKVMRSDVADELEEAFAQRFRRELSISKDLAHPYVVRILDGGFLPKGGGIYIVMELIDGENLAHLSDDGLPEEQMTKVLRHMAEALSYIHSKGLVHRDIKRENILVDKNGRTVLVDFGLALSSNLTRLTATTDRPGTLLSMAPEQIRGEDIDGRADIYALGVTAYTALTDKPPYDQEVVFQIALGIEPIPPERISFSRPDISPVLEQIIFKCMALSPKERYQRADELLEAIDSLQDDLSQTLSIESVDISTPAQALPKETASPLTPLFRKRFSVSSLVLLLLLLPLLYLRFCGEPPGKRVPINEQEWVNDLATLRDEILRSGEFPNGDTLTTLGELVFRAGLVKRLNVSLNCSKKLVGLYYLARIYRDRRLIKRAHELYTLLEDEARVSKELSLKETIKRELYAVRVEYVHQMLLPFKNTNDSEKRLTTAKNCRKMILPIINHLPPIKEWEFACDTYGQVLRYLETTEAKNEAITFAERCRLSDMTNSQKSIALNHMSSLLTAYRDMGLKANSLEHLQKARQYAVEALDYLPQESIAERWILLDRLIGIELKLSNFKGANEWLVKAVKANPSLMDSHEYLRVKASMAAYQGNYRRAVNLTEEALKKDLTIGYRQTYEKNLKYWRGFAALRKQ